MRMRRFTTALVGGMAIGLIIGASATAASDEDNRRKIMKTSKRAMRKAGNVLEDIF